jgi:YidC/Oxa1 family membrane protein insertase
MSAVNNTQTSDNDTMNATMKSMNTFMPIMSAVFCITLPAGLGVYWIASAVVRIFQQIGINAYMKRISVEDIITKNREKQNKKRAKQGLPPISDDTNTGRRNGNRIENRVKKEPTMPGKNVKNVDSSEYYKKQDYKEGGIASKARMVQNYNEKKTKK